MLFVNMSVCMAGYTRKLEEGRPGVFVEDAVYTNGIWDIPDGEGVNDLYKDLDDFFQLHLKSI